MAGLVGSLEQSRFGSDGGNHPCKVALLLSILWEHIPSGPASAILISSVVACAASIAGDPCRDLRRHVLGATPVKLLMQIVGVLAASLVMGPVLNLLNVAYGFAEDGIPSAIACSAPQAA